MVGCGPGKQCLVPPISHLGKPLFQVPVTPLCFFFSVLTFPVALTLQFLSVPLTLFLQYVKHVSCKVAPADDAIV